MPEKGHDVKRPKRPVNRPENPRPENLYELSMEDLAKILSGEPTIKGPIYGEDVVVVLEKHGHMSFKRIKTKAKRDEFMTRDAKIYPTATWHRISRELVEYLDNKHIN